ncbi:MAG: serine/threonine protein kinase [Sandaracinaceae bacterium]|nr:serine/threonine protein kinase [Sandaracinaceae bacterium]
MPNTTEDDEDRPTEAVSVPWGSAPRSLEEFDPDSFDVGVPTLGEASEPAYEDVPYGVTSNDEDPLDPFGHLTTGAELGGRYRLERIIGRGACGVVFEASHMVIGKKVAVKCLYPQLRSHPTLVERFFREARIAATVDHPHVIKVFDGGDEKNTLFLAMELLQGETLAERLDRGALAVGDAVEVFLKILDGVAAVHDKGVVHRDLKPENVYMTRAEGAIEGDPKVLDFGVSKLKQPGRKELTVLGAVMGTPYYMAPEQMLSAKDVDARADVYSLGVMLYEAITGELPYDGDNIADIFTAAKAGDWVPLEQTSADVSPLLSRVVEKAMQVDREARFGSVREMHRALLAAHEMGKFDPNMDAARTVDDMRSPLADVPITPVAPRPDHGEITAQTEMPRPTHVDDLHTRELANAPAATSSLPMWAIVAMVALAGLAVGSLALAIVALSL